VPATLILDPRLMKARRACNTDEDVLEEFRRACSTLGLRVSEVRVRTCQLLMATSTLLHLLLKRFDESIVKALTGVTVGLH